ncbi:MAG TPA: hypothetical protein VHL09_09315, partial [Dehalococcoidia bacterium]|nr:hypothetical protein [Dehalococcoidia bacterium]
AWALALYLVEAYHPVIGLDFVPSGRSAPLEASWYGVRVIGPGGDGSPPSPPTRGLIRLWDAIVADERPEGRGWLDIGGRFLQGQTGTEETLASLRDHLGLPDRNTLAPPPSRPRWIFYLTLLRAGVDLLIDNWPIALARGLDWPDILGDEAEPHPLRRAGVLGVHNAGAGEWIALSGHGSCLFIHRRDARLIDRRDGWRITPASAWLPDASWQVGRYLADRLAGQ